MQERERILRQIRQGRPMVVGNGGRTIRSTDEPQQPGEGAGASVKKHRWGA